MTEMKDISGTERRNMKRPPTAYERKAMARATKAIQKRSERPTGAFEATDRNSFVAVHNEELGSALLRMNDAFATASSFADAVFTGQLEFMTRERGTARGDCNTELNGALAVVASVEPQNEMEAALAIQMAGTHVLAAEMLGKARQASDMDRLETYANLAIKLQRTFAAQMEAMVKFRTGGKQTVEVKYVDARNSQNIIAETVNAGSGVGGGIEAVTQPLAQALAHQPGPPCAPVSCEVQTDRMPLQGAGD